MCELFAQSFNKPVRPGKVMYNFLDRGLCNPDGTGIAYALPDKSMIVRKQPVMALKSPLIEKVMKSTESVSNLFLLHVRLASPGLNKNFENCHPFKFTLNNRDWVFMHNGTLRGQSRQLPLGQYKPSGQTDSEFSFAYILSEISKQQLVWNEDGFKKIHSLLCEINNMGSFNIIMTDGKLLFCYSDINMHNGGLGYVKNHLSENSGYTVSTKPLTVEPFTQFSPGELKVYKQGEEVFSSQERKG